MTYPQTIEFLYTRLPLFSRIGAAAIKKDLHNTIALCAALGNPHLQFKNIHIAGTNGKGSVSHMLAAIFQTAGYKTGLYTSPHLHDFRERIKINGTPVREDFVVSFTERVLPMISKLEPSFFEITVAMAFEYFASENVDIAIIETGLGGRLDSTNVVQPLLSVITNIGWDHMNLLGTTLPEIAFEKAGIIKQHTPVVIGEYLPETKPVFEQKATEVQAPIIWAQEEQKVLSYKLGKKLQAVIQNKAGAQNAYELDLTGLYQLKNVLPVLAAVELLQEKGWLITTRHVTDALQQVQHVTGLEGRWQVVQQNPTVVLDVGHNEDGIRQILKQLEELNYQDLHIVLGMVKDKEVQKVLQLMPQAANYYFTKAQIPRALEETVLQQMARVEGLSGTSYSNVNEALQIALQNAKATDFILVCGSVFLVGEVDLVKAGVREEKDQ